MTDWAPLFNTSLSPLPSFRVTEVQESNKFCSNYLVNVNQLGWIWLYCWDLLVLWIWYSFCLFSLLGREPYLCDFVEKTNPKPVMFACIWTFTDRFLSNFVDKRSPKSTFWYQFRWPWPIKVTVVCDVKNFCAHFLANFWTSFFLMKFAMLWQLLAYWSSSWIWHALYLEYAFSIGLCWDACEPVSFKSGLMLGTTKLCSVIPVWIN